MKQPPFVLFIVDDDEDDLLFIHNAFKELGLDNVCKGFLSGEELLQHFRFNHYNDLPDLIVLDYEMPRMNGKEILKTLRKTAELEKVPVLFYSDKITAEVEKELLSLGAFCCIRKGITSGDQVKFAKAVTEFLHKSSKN